LKASVDLVAVIHFAVAAAHKLFSCVALQSHIGEQHPETSKALKDLLPKIEALANVAIIFVAILLGGVLVKRYILEPQDIASLAFSSNQSSAQKIDLPGVDWSKSGKTLVMAISSACHFCTDSAPFYRRVAETHSGVQLVAVLPQTVDEGAQYLRKLRFDVDKVVQAPLLTIDVSGTPTLMLVNADGAVIGKWVGQLSAAQEADVLNQVKSDNANN
jgi:hypothetical protein